MIVLSYRRADSPGFARALRERLVRELGADRIFLDVETIEAGEDFRERLRSAVAAAEALVVIIGPDWLAPAPSFPNRLHEADDAVRLEIVTALQHDVPVIPVLVDGAAMPDAAHLPDDVRPLADRNAVVLGNERFEADVEELLDVLGAGARRRTRRYLTGLGGALALAAAAIVVMLVVQQRANAPFTLTVEAREGASGVHVADGDIVLRAGDDAWTRPVNTDGRARFEELPASLHGATVTLTPRVAGFDTVSQTVSLAQEHVELRLRRTPGPSVTMNGVVLDAAGRGVPGVSLDFDAGLATATSDSAGNFTVTVPRGAGALVRLRAVRDGVLGYHDDITLQGSTLLVVRFDPEEADGANDR